jgi:hypothetical protein
MRIPMTCLLPLCLLMLSCHPPSPAAPRHPTVATACPDAPGDLVAATFNAGLAPGVVSLATPRNAHVAAALADYRETGVMCLQEFWLPESRDAAIAALGLPPENVYHVDTSGQGDDLTGVNVCSREQFDPLAACVRQKCAGVADEETTLCALSQCRTKLIGLFFDGGEDCINCLVSSVGGTVAEIESACVPPGKGVSHSYRGHNGVILVSKWPLTEREHALLPSSIANRAALFATVRPPGRAPIEVACAHISTSNELPPSHRGSDGERMFSDWDEEMNAQIRLISTTMKRRAADGRIQLFVADVNAGPDLPGGISSQSTNVWKTILAEGFWSPAAAADKPFCSTCVDDTLRPGSTKNYLIDHVLVRDPPGGDELEPVCAERFMTGRQTIAGYRGERLESNLSDHYGVRVRFRFRK